MYNRMNLLAIPHKALRYALNGLSFKAGTIDSQDDVAVSSFIKELHSISLILEMHSHSEDTHMHPLYEKYCPEVAEKLENDHENLDSRILKIRDLSDHILSSQNQHEIWTKLASELNQFIADYFTHLQIEERIALPVLWQHMTDEELFTIHGKIVAEQNPQISGIFLSYMLPALNQTERFQVLAHAKISAPKPAYEGICHLAENVLDASVWNELKQKLQNV